MINKINKRITNIEYVNDLLKENQNKEKRFTKKNLISAKRNIDKKYIEN
jgi:hypothetical protein